MKNQINFMTLEYEQITQAHFRLKENYINWFKHYITIISVPLTFIGAMSDIFSDRMNCKMVNPISFSNLPDLISLPIILIGLFGILIYINIVSVRLEMILYARTINKIRKYFCDIPTTNDKYKIKEYIVLPTNDKFPKYNKLSLNKFTFAFIVGVANGLLISLGITNIAIPYINKYFKPINIVKKLCVFCEFTYNFSIFIILFLIFFLSIIIIHFFIYLVIAYKNENSAVKKSKKSK